MNFCAWVWWGEGQLWVNWGGAFQRRTKWCDVTSVNWGEHSKPCSLRFLTSLGLWLSLEMSRCLSKWRHTICFRTRSWGFYFPPPPLWPASLKIGGESVSSFLCLLMSQTLWCHSVGQTIITPRLINFKLGFFLKKHRIVINSIPVLWGTVWVWKHQHGEKKSTWWESFKRIYKWFWTLKIMKIMGIAFILWNDEYLWIRKC